MCATLALNSPRRRPFLTNLSSLIAASQNMILTKKQMKDGDWQTHFPNQQGGGWNEKDAQQVLRVGNEDKRFAWFIHFSGGWEVAALSDKTVCRYSPPVWMKPPRHKTYNHNKSCCSSSHYAASVKVLARISVCRLTSKAIGSHRGDFWLKV